MIVVPCCSSLIKSKKAGQRSSVDSRSWAEVLWGEITGKSQGCHGILPSFEENAAPSARHHLTITVELFGPNLLRKWSFYYFFCH